MTIEEDTAPYAPSGSPGEPVVLGGRYVLGERLGQGGMAEVFRARDTVLRRDVAVKRFHRTVEIPDAALRRSGEVTLLAGLAHPHLVTLFDAGRDEDDSYDYLVMEFVRGTTLVPRVPLPADVVARIGAQLADALAYVHERNIVHRDVKPANVLLDANGTEAKLTDFGVARLVDATALTVHGTTLGTPNYLSPEQATGAPVTGASDVYSLGLVLFEALTGEKAYPGSGIEAAVARLHRDPELPPWVDAHWRELIAAMTARDPQLRPTAATVAARLRAWSSPATDATQVLGAVAPNDTRVLAVPAGRVGNDERSRRRPVWLAALFVGLLAVGAVLVAAFGNSGSAPARPAAPTSSAPDGRAASASAASASAASASAASASAASASAASASRASASAAAARASASRAAAAKAARASASRAAASRAAAASASRAAASRSAAQQQGPGKQKGPKPGKGPGGPGGGGPPGKNKP